MVCDSFPDAIPPGKGCCVPKFPFLVTALAFLGPWAARKSLNFCSGLAFFKSNIESMPDVCWASSCRTCSWSLES